MDELDKIRATFKANLDSVVSLINFDREVQDYAITQVEELHKRLKKGGIDNARLNAERTLEILKNIRRNDSLRPRYEVIFNQALVLLVSHFGSAVGDIFRYAVMRELERKNQKLLKEEIRMSLADVMEAAQDFAEAIPDLFVAKKDISFQDMQSIHRAFKEHVDLAIVQDEAVDDIILSQACRHVIVHRGGVVDARMIRQLRGATKRRLKPHLEEKDVLQFSPVELEQLAKTMLAYVDRLCDAVREKGKASGSRS